MSPDLPEKVLDISFDDSGEREQPGPDEGGDEEEYGRFLFFAIGHQRLAVDVDDVKTVIDTPGSITDVPRSPPAIEGVTDIRGEITAIVDPRVHFPTDEPPPKEESLLVFDRPADRQAAAMRIDAVRGVDPIPEDDVLDPGAVESSEFDGHSLEHPLVVALIRRERTDAETPVGIERDASDRSDESPTLSAVAGVDRSTDVGGAASETTDDEAITERKVVLEATPLVDVERLLLASGPESTKPRVESS